MYKKFFMALIVIIGSFTPHVFAAPGDLDTTFNPTGVQPGTKSTKIDNFTSNNSGQSVALQSDGKIVVAGLTLTGGGGTDFKFAVARFNTDGTLDTTFTNGGPFPGTITTSVDNNTRSEGYAVAIQSDGKIVVAGHTDVGGGVFNLAVARLNTNGTLDTTFNAGGAQPGTVSTLIDNSVVGSSGRSVAIQSDGKIVVGGYADFASGAGEKFAVARFNTNGTLDTSFNAGGAQPGTVATDIDNQTGPTHLSTGYSIAIQSNGAIVIAGEVRITSGPLINRFGVARFLSTGVLDTSFNAGGAQPGTASTPINTITNSTDSYGRSVALQSDGKIVIAGFTVNPAGSGIIYFSVARYLSTGTLDTSFNPSPAILPGTLTTTIDNIMIDNEGYAVAIQQNGKIVVAGGFSNLINDSEFAVARFNTNGTLDTTFVATIPGAQPGTLKTTIDNQMTFNVGYSVVIQSDGKIVIAGLGNVAGEKFAVARFTGDPVVPVPGSTTTTNLCALRLIEKYGPKLQETDNSM